VGATPRARRARPGSPWRAEPGRSRRGPPARRAQRAVAAIKVGHTLAWLSIETCLAYVIWAGIARRSDRRAAVAGGVVAGESLIFAANRFRCPLTQLAERLGAERGSVTDISLPGWLAHNLAAIHAPLIALAGLLHARNLRRQAPARLGTHRRRRRDRARIDGPRPSRQ
jgi:hypothetical protein